MPLDNRSNRRVRTGDVMGTLQQRKVAPSIYPMSPGPLRPPFIDDFRPMVLKVITLDLATARDKVRHNVAGTTLIYFGVAVPADPSHTLAEYPVTVRYNTQQVDGIPFTEGKALQGIPFDCLFITNDAIAGAIATLVYYHEYPNNPANFK